MTYSIIYLLAFIAFMVAIMLYPKAEKISFATNGMLSYVTTMICGTIGALVLQIAGVFVSIKSLSWFYIVATIIIILVIWRKKKVQAFFFQKSELFVLLFGIICIGLLGVHIFSRHLNINYTNMCDPANHFLFAVNITRSGKLGGMFFNPLQNALFMEILQPLVPETWNYKLFILSDGFQTLMEWYFFYCIITYKMRNSRHKYIPFLITVLYCCGYPLYSYAGGAYMYWAMGAMLVQYVYFMMQLFEDQPDFRTTYIILMFLGCFGVTLCYILFAPATFLMVIGLLLYYALKQGKIVFNKKFFFFVAMVGLIGVICVALGYYYVFASRGVSIIKAFGSGINTSKNLEILIFTPIFYYIIYYHVKHKSYGTYSIALCSFTVIQIIFTLMATVNIVSSYYLFKGYYIFWSFIWLGIVSERNVLSGKIKKYIIHYLFLSGILLMFLYVPQGESETTEAVSLDNSIWRYNAVQLQTDYRDPYLSIDKVELMEYAADYAKQNQVTIPMLGNNALRGVCAWYAGITNQPYYWTSPVDEEVIREFLNRTGYQYLLVFKDCDVYLDNVAYLRTFEIVYEIDEGIIYRVSEE